MALWLTGLDTESTPGHQRRFNWIIGPKADQIVTCCNQVDIVVLLVRE